MDGTDGGVAGRWVGFVVDSSVAEDSKFAVGKFVKPASFGTGRSTHLTD